VNSLLAEGYYLGYKDFSFTKLEPYKQGNGLYLNSGISNRAFDLLFTYWEGNGYQAIKGAPVYQSVSQHIGHPGYTEDERRLLFIRLISRFPLTSGFYIETRLEPYIDLNHLSFEFSNSLFLIWKERFSLKKIKA
jgi:hypothetical protein